MMNSGGGDNSPDILALAQEVRDLCAPPLRHFVVRPTGNPSEYTLMASCAFTDLDAARAFDFAFRNSVHAVYRRRTINVLRHRHCALQL